MNCLNKTKPNSKKERKKIVFPTSLKRSSRIAAKDTVLLVHDMKLFLIPTFSHLGTGYSF